MVVRHGEKSDEGPCRGMIPGIAATPPLRRLHLNRNVEREVIRLTVVRFTILRDSANAHYHKARQ